MEPEPQLSMDSSVFSLVYSLVHSLVKYLLSVIQGPVLLQGWGSATSKSKSLPSFCLHSREQKQTEQQVTPLFQPCRGSPS